MTQQQDTERTAVLKDKTILIVDDSPVIRNIIKASLQPLGPAKLLEAEDGDKALAALNRETVHLVIADWKMPNATGLDLLEKVRQSENLSKTPFILISSVPERDMITKSIALSVTGVLVKPLDTRILKNTVLKALGG